MKLARPPWLLVLAVLALHLLLGREIDRIASGWAPGGQQPMPARMQVDFVREMVLRPPPAVARVAPRPVRVAPAPPPAEIGDTTLPVPLPLPPEAGAEAASAPAADEPGPEWPLSTRLSYVLTGNYRGPVHGQAQVEWLRRGSDYQVRLDVGVGPSFAPFITRQMSSQGRLTPEGIAPQRYDEETRFLLGETRRASVVLADGGPQRARGAQDAASQFVQLSWLFLTGREPLRAGAIVAFPLALPRRRYDWQYELVGEELLATPMGPLAAWHLRPTRAAQQALLGGDLVAEVWLAPALQYLPVRILIRQDAQTHIDLVLKAPPLQAEPESANPIPRRPSP